MLYCIISSIRTYYDIFYYIIPYYFTVSYVSYILLCINIYTYIRTHTDPIQTTNEIMARPSIAFNRGTGSVHTEVTCLYVF